MPIRQILRRAGALVLLLASTASAQLAFSSAPIFPPVPLAVIADVNGDGWLDACGSDLTGDGNVDLLTADLVAIEGSAAGPTDHVVDSPGPPMHDIVLADFNGDDVSDVAGIGSGGLMILPSASGVWHELQHSLAGSQG
jgi:hypothetical protein